MNEKLTARQNKRASGKSPFRKKQADHNQQEKFGKLISLIYI